MGNTLVTSDSDRRINDSILGKRISQILRDNEELNDDKNMIKINKARACCLNVAKSNDDLGQLDFVTVKLPDPVDNNDLYCREKGKCLQSANLGLTFPNTTCENDFKIGTDNKCKEFMVNKCAKELYDKGCIIVEKRKNSDGTEKKDDLGRPRYYRKWNSKNKNCFTKDGDLAYGSEDCTCLNSMTGFTLNNDPGNEFKGGAAFKTNAENPYGVVGASSNNLTKYSLNIFGYDSQYQYPQAFDSRCASAKANRSVQSGKSKPYLLDAYNETPNICLNQINIKDSDIGRAEMKNIQQNNNCGGTGRKDIDDIPINEDGDDVEVDEENAVDKDTHDERIHDKEDEIIEENEEDEDGEEDDDNGNSDDEEEEDSDDEDDEIVDFFGLKIQKKTRKYIFYGIAAIIILLLIIIIFSGKKEVSASKNTKLESK